MILIVRRRARHIADKIHRGAHRTGRALAILVRDSDLKQHARRRRGGSGSGGGIAIRRGGVG